MADPITRRPAGKMTPAEQQKALALLEEASKSKFPPEMRKELEKMLPELDQLEPGNKELEAIKRLLQPQTPARSAPSDEWPVGTVTTVGGYHVVPADIGTGFSVFPPDSDMAGKPLYHVKDGKLLNQFGEPDKNFALSGLIRLPDETTIAADTRIRSQFLSSDIVIEQPGQNKTRWEVQKGHAKVIGDRESVVKTLRNEVEALEKQVNEKLEQKKQTAKATGGSTFATILGILAAPFTAGLSVLFPGLAAGSSAIADKVVGDQLQKLKDELKMKQEKLEAAEDEVAAAKSAPYAFQTKVTFEELQQKRKLEKEELAAKAAEKEKADKAETQKPKEVEKPT